MKSLLELLPSNNFPHKSSTIFLSNKTIKSEELSLAIKEKAIYLRNNGIEKDEVVAILSENNLEFIESVFALWNIGAIPAPLNTKLLHKELIEQVEYLGSKRILRNKNLSELKFQQNTIDIKEKESTGIFDNFDWTRYSSDKTALILFTSGSSGKPKAVELSFNNLIQSAIIGNKIINHTEEDKWLASLPFYHIGGFSIIFRALIFGASLIIPDSSSTDDFKISITKYKPTLTSLVSNQLKNFVSHNFIPNKELRLILIGGGFSNSGLILKAIKNGWNISKVYGSTETSSFISFMNTEKVKQKTEASGKILPPNEIIVTNEGEIAVKGPTVMKRYFNDIKETEAKLKNNFYFTGDIGFLDNEGYLFIEARRTDLIVSGGENINPVEVEEVIKLHKAISEVCVVGFEDEEWGQIVSTAIVLKEDCSLTETDLKKFLKDKLSSFKIPKRIIFVKQLPKSSLGKILREETKKIFVV